MVQSNRNSPSSSLSLHQDSALKKGSNTFGTPAFTQRARATNGSLATATFLGTFPSSKKVVRNSVGKGNPVDFFRIDLSKVSRIKLDFVNRSGAKLNAAILDANGNLVTSKGRKQLSIAANQQTDTLIRGAQPGVYYLRIKGPASSTNRYSFNLFANASGEPAPLPCGCGG